ncbi:GNAT family N-acetyltransferase [Hymenobacter cheonanensis]|uniref:GNAT family N-acetyltransferase n=1 Tax=Hymenobacter sp. CA2-7 TaxID=3063993 RepID=UPI002712E418|nr:GNAT family N-acetyltransferase [Hymenobacter sp. CA2-7]MDO7886646.1 GNAT family N-acetyltransferase [Hymenobacter sp. CA2-7]
MTIRPAAPVDFEAIYAIWLEGIAHSFAGFAHPPDLREQFHHNFATCQPPFGFWVAEEAGQVLGWQSLLPCTSNPLKRYLLAESSTYVAADVQLKGLGESLLRKALNEAGMREIQFVIGWVRTNNSGIAKMVARCGFVLTQPGFVPQVPPLTHVSNLWVYTVPTPEHTIALPNS